MAPTSIEDGGFKSEADLLALPRDEHLRSKMSVKICHQLMNKMRTYETMFAEFSCRHDAPRVFVGC